MFKYMHSIETFLSVKKMKSNQQREIVNMQYHIWRLRSTWNQKRLVNFFLPLLSPCLKVVLDIFIIWSYILKASSQSSQKPPMNLHFPPKKGRERRNYQMCAQSLDISAILNSIMFSHGVNLKWIKNTLYVLKYMPSFRKNLNLCTFDANFVDHYLRTFSAN